MKIKKNNLIFKFILFIFYLIKIVARRQIFRKMPSVWWRQTAKISKRSTWSFTDEHNATQNVTADHPLLLGTYFLLKQLDLDAHNWVREAVASSFLVTWSGAP